MASRQYDTLSQAVNGLNKKGFTHSFDFKENGLNCSDLGTFYQKDDLHIVETHRFEGESSTDDSSVVYAIAANDGTKGLLVDAYGAYADADKAKFLMGIAKDETAITTSSTQ